MQLQWLPERSYPCWFSCLISGVCSGRGTCTCADSCGLCACPRCVHHDGGSHMWTFSTHALRLAASEGISCAAHLHLHHRALMLFSPLPAALCSPTPHQPPETMPAWLQCLLLSLCHILSHVLPQCPRLSQQPSPSPQSPLAHPKQQPQSRCLPRQFPRNALSQPRAPGQCPHRDGWKQVLARRHHVIDCTSSPPRQLRKSAAKECHRYGSCWQPWMCR